MQSRAKCIQTQVVSVNTSGSSPYFMLADCEAYISVLGADNICGSDMKCHEVVLKSSLFKTKKSTCRSVTQTFLLNTSQHFCPLLWNLSCSAIMLTGHLHLSHCAFSPCLISLLVHGDPWECQGAYSQINVESKFTNNRGVWTSPSYMSLR